MIDWAMIGMILIIAVTWALFGVIYIKQDSKENKYD